MTIRELSNLCNVHYNTMRKWLADNKIKKESDQLNSRYLITEEVIKKAKEQFLKEPLEESNKEGKIDNILLQQLEQKDKQIVKHQEQINHLQKILENQQILTLKAQEKVLSLESEKNNTKEQYKKTWFGLYKKEARKD